MENQYTVLLKGGSLGEITFSDKRQLKGKQIKENTHLTDKETAKLDAKNSNKHLSVGEKKYYRLKYVVVEVEGNCYTGK